MLTLESRMILQTRLALHLNMGALAYSLKNSRQATDAILWC